MPKPISKNTSPTAVWDRRAGSAMAMLPMEKGSLHPGPTALHAAIARSEEARRSRTPEPRKFAYHPQGTDEHDGQSDGPHPMGRGTQRPAKQETATDDRKKQRADRRWPWPLTKPQRRPLNYASGQDSQQWSTNRSRASTLVTRGYIKTGRGGRTGAQVQAKSR